MIATSQMELRTCIPSWMTSTTTWRVQALVFYGVFMMNAKNCPMELSRRSQSATSAHVERVISLAMLGVAPGESNRVLEEAECRLRALRSVQKRMR